MNNKTYTDIRTTIARSDGRGMLHINDMTLPVHITSIDYSYMDANPSFGGHIVYNAPVIFGPSTHLAIKRVIFNDPATIVFWKDGSKTVVKCQDYDIFDPEKGLAMAMCKKALGNKGNYNNAFKKWLDEYYKKEAEEVENGLKRFCDIFGKIAVKDDPNDE